MIKIANITGQIYFLKVHLSQVYKSPSKRPPVWVKGAAYRKPLLPTWSPAIGDTCMLEFSVIVIINPYRL